MKRIILIFGLLGLMANTAQCITETKMRTQGLVYIGIALGICGIYDVAKRSESFKYTVIETMRGLTFLAAGIILIGLSEELIQEINNCFR